jgi:hypothetical protein
MERLSKIVNIFLISVIWSSSVNAIGLGAENLDGKADVININEFGKPVDLKFEDCNSEDIKGSGIDVTTEPSELILKVTALSNLDERRNDLHELKSNTCNQ